LSSGRAPLSVIIPCYRCQDTLRRALASVEGQTWPPAEVLVVSDGNPPEIQGALKEIVSATSLNVRFLPLPHNVGPGEARNKAWDQATQAYIAFLDADDAWHPQKVERQLGWMLSHPQVAFSAHLYGRFSPEVGHYSHAPGDPRPIPPFSLFWRNPISTPTVILRRELPFRFPKQRYAEDYALWLRLALSGHPPYLFEEILAWGYKAPWGEGGLSARLWEMEKGELQVYLSLAQEGVLPRGWLPLLLGWSMARFMRRLLLSWLLKAF